MLLVEVRERTALAVARVPMVLEQFSHGFAARGLVGAGYALKQGLDGFVGGLPEGEKITSVGLETIDCAIGIAARAGLVILDLTRLEGSRLCGLDKRLTRLGKGHERVISLGISRRIACLVVPEHALHALIGQANDQGIDVARTFSFLLAVALAVAQN